ncbi:hypothetical protein Ae168Ps1_2457c [Pseudonocardia sp. Ae168_Ps1]|nr:hypothetical protein Ae150APs1_2452c [Pseudonocardia sp. Ae150A_Ps1]OLL80051.1 hypothetical protein Ae168Ps1_2457c [Pseudonocardia sp. Ae168_Ps1]OLL85817.1 hypothetical protein Ae263Ps1_2872 [Pseudonocardia sp. Ae263_Ps1]OLL94153.1 hypothetical protein Ae356Ps1_4050c [Pseudonocardia sp. Ae356_Ps1]
MNVAGADAARAGRSTTGRPPGMIFFPSGHSARRCRVYRSPTVPAW